MDDLSAKQRDEDNDSTQNQLDTPHRNFIAAILLNAIHDLYRFQLYLADGVPREQIPKTKKHRRNTMIWLEGKKPSRTPFAWCLAALDLDRAAFMESLKSQEMFNTAKRKFPPAPFLSF